MASRSIDMQCWKCGVELKQVLLPFSRYEECSACNADLHACFACSNFDPGVADSCREDRADSVLDKDRANFCDYFSVNPKAYKKTDDSAAREAKLQLAALFGDEVFGDEELGDEVLGDEVVGDKSAKDGEPEESSAENRPLSESERALAELKQLFGDDVS